MKKYTNIEARIIPIIAAMLLLVVWQLSVDSGLIKSFILPSPYNVAAALINIFPDLVQHIAATLQEAFIGFIAAIILSIALAVLMDNVKLIKEAIYPMLVVSQTIPIIALAPLFVIWFGFGMLPKIIVVVLVCFFPIVISLMDGLEAVDKDIINLMRSMGAKKLQIFYMVKFPAAIIGFFSGLRIAATYSIMGAVIGEWLGGKAGLGVYMLRVKHSYSLDKVFAVIVVIVVLSMLLFKLISMLQRILMPWSIELEMQNNK